MNFLLLLNKKFYLVFLLIILLLIFFLFIYTYIESRTNITEVISLDLKKADITEPKFAISSNKEKISVTAKEGFFLTNDQIKLEKNVIFKSTEFSIVSDNVIFNKKDLNAFSNDKSKFLSENASIDSIGFDITENGNIINFKGKTKLTLKWLSY